MSDPLYDLLASPLQKAHGRDDLSKNIDADFSSRYLSRLLSLRVSDLTTTEPQSLTQAYHSNHVSLQALSSRSHRTTTASASHLSTLHTSLPSLSNSTTQVREAIPSLDESAVTFASTYARSRDVENPTLQARRDSALLARQSDKLTDILELPSLLSTAIASAGSGAAGGANYSQALDLFAHIKRLSIIYPDSALVRSVQGEAEQAMKSMATNLLSSLRAQNIRLAAAIRTIGWLRRVVPELSDQPTVGSGTTTNLPTLTTPADTTQTEGSFGALFLVSRLHTFLSMTEALAPLRDLADLETEKRISRPPNTDTLSPPNPTTPLRRQSSTTNSSLSTGAQTERYLKRYIEIFREHSFNTISMYRNIFPEPTAITVTNDPLALPSALQQFPLHLVEVLMGVLRTYLPNVTDPAARESLLTQVLYAAGSLGRLGADFSLMIALLDDQEEEGGPDGEDGVGGSEPEWARVIKKHRVQAARLDALAAGQSQNVKRSVDVAVR